VDSNRQNAGRSPDEDEGRRVKPHQPPEDGHLEEAGIKEDLEERERRGESTYTRNQTPYTILLQDRRQIPVTTPVDKQPVTAGRDGDLKTEKAGAC